ncbi:MAG TPA: helix-turn-helix domain-containing protein [Candidatus Peribacteraceae bacterium]|nr:helix-turn-helix domain-containing protein [Candidatus Peribacteraceae bacterium]
MVTPADWQRITSLLGSLGCNEREIQIYLQCLRAGPETVREIAQQMKQNRITVHSAIDQLIDKGFLTETRRGKKRIIIAEEPSSIHGLLQKKQNELKLLRANAVYVAGILESLKAPHASRPTVKFYEGVDGFKYMLEETLKTRGEVLVFTYVDLFSQVLGPDYLEDYFIRRAAKRIHTRLIFPPCQFARRVNAKAKQYRIQVRLLPPEIRWKSGIFSWDTTIALMSYTEGRFTTTFVENPDIAHFYRSVIFELCWRQAKPMEADKNDKAP